MELATPGQEVLGSIPEPAPYSLVQCQYNVTDWGWTDVMVSPLCDCVAARRFVIRPRYILVADEEVYKQNKPNSTV